MRFNAVCLALSAALGAPPAHGQLVCLFETPLLFPPPHGVIAVAVDDLDGDGDQDVIVPEFGKIDGSGAISVFRNTGDGTLATPETYDAPGIHMSVAVGHLNADQAPDIALPNFGAGTVSIYLNQGDGTFATPVEYAAGVPGPRGIAIGDMDGDGDNDLVVGDLFVNVHAVMFNDGAGVFRRASTFTEAGTTIDVSLADLDGDTDLDAVFVFNGVYVHRNLGDGTFEPGAQLAAGQFGSVITADLDDDGHLDIAVTQTLQNSDTDNVIVFFNGGDGTTFKQSVFPVNKLTRDIATGDFNDDGRLDLVASHVSTVNKISVLRNVGDRDFDDPVEFTPGTYPQSIVVADMTGDGLDDIVAALEFHNPPSVAVMINGFTIGGDVDRDGMVNFSDLLAVLAAWGPYEPCPPFKPEDLDEDCEVGFSDLLVVLATWGPCE